jgi:geranylgeranylglycerol-phosphate geranylgeranyltransferase
MKSSPLLVLARPLNCAITGVAVLIGVVVAIGRLRVEVWPLLIPFLAAAIVAGGGNAINDYFDRTADRINRPDRPIPSGAIKAERALEWSQAFFVLGIGLSAFAGLYCFALAIINSIVLVTYSWRIKRRGLMGNLTIGYLVGSSFLFGGLAAYSLYDASLLPAELLLLVLMAALSTVGRELIKGIQDMPGDRKMKLKTFSLKHGAGKAATLAIVFMAAAIAISPIPYFIGIFGQLYLMLVAVSIAAFVAAAAIIARGRDVKSAGQASLACKAGMALGLLAFLVGAFTTML